MFKKISKVADFFALYGNPFELGLRRYIAPNGIVRVMDKATGITCRCTFASYRMFREVWFDRDYDMPKLPIRNGDVVIDIGANQGFYSLYAAHLGARVYAFEPSKPSYEMMLDNLRHNQLQDRVQAMCCAVSGRTEAVELICSNMLGGGMNTIQQKFAAVMFGDEVKERSLVESITLASVIERFGLEKIRLCKIDCEGSEFEIIKSLTPDMVRRFDAFVMELHHGVYDVEEMVKLVMSWGTHQVSFAEDKYCKREILRLVSNETLLACARD